MSSYLGHITFTEGMHMITADPTYSDARANIDARLSLAAPRMTDILDFIRNNPGRCTSARRVAREMGLNRVRVDDALEVLYRAGVVDFERGSIKSL